MGSEMFTFPELPKLSKILNALGEIGCFNPHAGAGYELQKLCWYRNALFENFAPYKVGDRVVMHTAYSPKESSGWGGYDEMMQPGARAVVIAVDWKPQRYEDKACGNGYFSFGVMFDCEWRVSAYDGTRRDIAEDQRHVFWFGRPDRYWHRDVAHESNE